MQRNLFTPIISQKTKIAFLHFPNMRGDVRRHRQDFLHQKNFGAAMITDVLFKAGFDVKITDKENAKYYDIVLISLTSNLDMISLTKYLHNSNEWKNRKFKVIAGGFGMQNYIPISEYIDYAWYGRVENEIVWLIENNFDVEHKSLIKIGKHKNVYINQSNILYPDVFTYSNNLSTKEQIYGCPNKCFFCHYSFSRKHISTNNNLYKLQQSSKSSIEIEQCKKELYDNFNIGEVYSSIDGYSERLRYAVNKRISNDQFIDFVEYCVNNTKCKALRMRFYNIIGYETETILDYQEFINTVSKIKKLKKYVTISIQSTPLNPSILTPMAYAPIDLKYDYNKFKVGKGLVKGINIAFQGDNMKVIHSYFQEDASSLIEHTLPIRTTFDNIELFKILSIDKKYNNLKTNDKIEFMSKINGFNDIIREYSINEELPSQYVNSFIEYDKLKLMRTKMRNALYNNA